MKCPLIEAVVENDVQRVKQLLIEGAIPNSYEDRDEVTPLHFVAQSMEKEALQIAELLLLSGANLYAKTKPDDVTPIDIARLCGNTVMLEYMMGFAKLQ